MLTHTSFARLVVLLCTLACVAALGGLTLAERRVDAGQVGSSGLLAVPGPPENVQASHDQADYIEVTWDDVADATNYQVLRATSEYGTYTIVNQEAVTQTRWLDLWALSGQGYWYKVRSCSLEGCGLRSDAASGYRNGPPLPPTELTASAGVYTDTIGLNWTESEDTIDYDILRNTVNDPDGALVLFRVSAPPQDDMPPLPDTTYWYWVTAINAHGPSRYSEPARGYCGEEPPNWQITPTPTDTPTLYVTATEGPAVTNTPTATVSETPTSGLTTPTSGLTTPTATLTPTGSMPPTLTATPDSSATPSETGSPTKMLYLPVIRR